MRAALDVVRLAHTLCTRNNDEHNQHYLQSNYHYGSGKLPYIDWTSSYKTSSSTIDHPSESLELRLLRTMLIFRIVLDPVWFIIIIIVKTRRVLV